MKKLGKKFLKVLSFGTNAQQKIYRFPGKFNTILAFSHYEFRLGRPRVIAKNKYTRDLFKNILFFQLKGLDFWTAKKEISWTDKESFEMKY